MIRTLRSLFKTKKEVTMSEVNATVEIYTTTWCPYCKRAKHLLSAKGVPFEETDVADPDLRSQMRERADGRHTVPQIFINDHGIGGCDELHALDARGELDTLLSESPA